MKPLLAIVLLAQAVPWVDFEVCYIDQRELPHVAKKSPTREVVSVRPDDVRVIMNIYPAPMGVDCVQIGLPRGRVYVIGTRSEVKRRLDEALARGE